MALLRRVHPFGLVALVLTLVGLGTLYGAMVDGVPIVFFGTDEERLAREEGRHGMVRASVVLAAAATLLAAGRRPAQAAFVAAAAVVPLALGLASPGAGYAWPALLVLGSAAAGAALTTAVRPR